MKLNIKKENIELFNKLAEKFVLINSDDLLQLIKKAKEEKNKKKDIVDKKEEAKPLRKLFDISASKTFNLGSFDVFGQVVSARYEVGISGGNAYNKIIISSGLGSFEFGNGGVSGEISDSKSYLNQYLFLLCLLFQVVFNGS